MSQTDVVDSHVIPLADTQGTNYGVRTGGAISLASSRLYLSDVLFERCSVLPFGGEAACADSYEPASGVCADGAGGVGQSAVVHERRRFTAAADALGGSRTQRLTAIMASLLCVHALVFSCACPARSCVRVTGRRAGPPGFFDLCSVDLYDSRVLDTRACSGGAFFARNGKFSLGATTIRRTKAYSGGMLAAVGLLEVRSQQRRR